MYDEDRFPSHRRIIADLADGPRFARPTASPARVIRTGPERRGAKPTSLPVRVSRAFSSVRGPDVPDARSRLRSELFELDEALAAYAVAGLPTRERRALLLDVIDEFADCVYFGGSPNSAELYPVVCFLISTSGPDQSAGLRDLVAAVRGVWARKRFSHQLPLPEADLYFPPL